MECCVQHVQSLMVYSAKTHTQVSVLPEQVRTWVQVEITFTGFATTLQCNRTQITSYRMSRGWYHGTIFDPHHNSHIMNFSCELYRQCEIVKHTEQNSNQELCERDTLRDHEYFASSAGI